MRIIHESISLSELQIDSTSSVAFLPKFVFLRLGVASSIRLMINWCFFRCFIESSFLCSSLPLHSSFLSSSELLWKIFMLHHMSFLSRQDNRRNYKSWRHFSL